MSIRSDLEALCRLEATMSVLTEQRDTLRRRLLDHALDTYENEGAAPTWRAGTLGSVGLTVPKAKAEVVDEDAFTAYVAWSYGDGAVETVQRVKSNVREAVLGSVQDHHEVVDGVTLKARLPYLQVRLSKEAKQAAADQLDIEEARILSLQMNADEAERWRSA